MKNPNGYSLKTVTSFLLTCFLFSSCSFIAKELVGFRSCQVLSEKKHKRLLRKMGATYDHAFLIDTNYINYLNLEDTVYKRFQKKNHAQPIQALYFGHQPYPEAWFINCYAPGIPNLNWNIDNAFGTFPPKSPVPLDSLLSFQQLFGLTIPLAGNPIPENSLATPYTVVIIWNRFIFRQSKRLNKYVQQNLKNSGVPYRIFYINNDNIFAFAEMEKQ